MIGAQQVVSVSPREQLQTLRGRQTQVAAHWNAYRSRLPAIISVSRMAMISEDFADYWNEICARPTALITSLAKQAKCQDFCVDNDVGPIATAPVSMLNQVCYAQLADASTAHAVGDGARIKSLSDIFNRTIYYPEGGQP